MIKVNEQELDTLLSNSGLLSSTPESVGRYNSVEFKILDALVSAIGNHSNVSFNKILEFLFKNKEDTIFKDNLVMKSLFDFLISVFHFYKEDKLETIWSFNDFISILRKYGFDPSSINVDEQDSIQFLAKYVAHNDRIEKINFFVENGADLNIKDKHNNNLLHLHASSNNDNTTLTKYLIEHKLDIESKNLWGYSPFHVAIQNNKINIVRYYIEHHLDKLSFKDIGPFSLSIYHLIALSKNKDILLLLNDLNVNIQTSINDLAEFKVHPIHFAAMSENIDFIDYAFKYYNVPLNIRDTHGSIPLHYAARYQKINAISHLEKLSPNINTTNLYGFTALHSAILHNNLLSLIYLFEHSAIIPKDVYGNDAYTIAKLVNNVEIDRALFYYNTKSSASFFPDPGPLLYTKLTYDTRKAICAEQIINGIKSAIDNKDSGVLSIIKSQNNNSSVIESIISELREKAIKSAVSSTSSALYNIVCKNINEISLYNHPLYMSYYTISNVTDKISCKYNYSIVKETNSSDAICIREVIGLEAYYELLRTHWGNACLMLI
ncbi:MAG: ankyrin repeat domain-containing protein [Pseudomonadota bacterium]